MLDMDLRNPELRGANHLDSLVSRLCFFWLVPVTFLSYFLVKVLHLVAVCIRTLSW